jgi:hypothetical protein
MKSRLTVGLVASAAILALAGPTHASAATEFGDSCLGDGIAPGSYTLTTLAAPSNVPITAPSSGVVTKVKTHTMPFSGAVPTSVKVLRSAGDNRFTVVNEAVVNIVGGQMTADVRLPIQAGDRLGLHGYVTTFEGSPPMSVSFYCNEESDSQLGAAVNDVTVGNSAAFSPVTSGRVPLAAVIEPDADNDGFGDETQDKCPISAAVQAACPPIVLDASALAGRKAVTVYIAAGTEGSVSVKGVVKLGKGKKATLKAGPKAVFPGKIASFRLKFNSNLTKRLQELEPSKKLTLKVTAGATNIAGVVSTDQTKVKLKGQG